MEFDQRPPNFGIEITVFDEKSGTTSVLEFEQFPVRLGRNPLNNLILDHPYVSQWHATVGTVAGRLHVQQVGTSNNLRVDNHELKVNEFVPLSGTEVLYIVPFRVTVKVLENQEERRRHEVVRSRGVRRGAVPTQPVAPISAASEYVDSHNRVPTIPAAPESGRPPPPPVPLPYLDVFCRRFWALAQGRKKFLDAVGIMLPFEGGADSLYGESADVLIRHLKAGNVNAATLDRLLGELSAHQVALLEGVMAGVRSLMMSISPEAISQEAAKAHPLLGPKGLWQTYERMYADLAEEGQETLGRIFGAEFGQAYVSALRRADSADPEKPNGSQS